MNRGAASTRSGTTALFSLLFRSTIMSFLKATYRTDSVLLSYDILCEVLFSWRFLIPP